jgi:predicted metal-dependent hydrolase
MHTNTTAAASLTVTTMQLGSVSVDVVRKDIKNIHLSVYPPTGTVRIAAPSRMSLDTIRVYAISRLPWIKQHQQKLQNQPRETPREYLERESHYLWGQRYLLELIEASATPHIELKHHTIQLRTRPGTEASKRAELLEAWYRECLRQKAPALIEKWERHLGVKVERFYVQRMKTRWGSCRHDTGSIRLNTDLAKKPIECLEYILVHEMIHLLEPTHNQRFVDLMDRYLPNWRHQRAQLNNLPVRHADWTY